MSTTLELSEGATNGLNRLSGTGPSGPIVVAKDRGYLILSVLTGSGTFSTSMEYRETIASGSATSWSSLTSSASAANDQLVTEGCPNGVKFDTTDATAKWTIHWRNR